jgi:hypothetical protein
VRLLYFRAEAAESAIHLNWGSAAEWNLSGYYIYRADVRQFDVAEPITFMPAEGSGSSYDYVDLDVQAGQVYWYWLVSVDTDGSETRSAPVQATTGTGAPQGFRIYLPFLGRDR